MTDYAHRRGLTIWQRLAIVIGSAALVVMFVGMWQEAAPGSQPAPPTTADVTGFSAPPRMTLGTRPPP